MRLGLFFVRLLDHLIPVNIRMRMIQTIESVSISFENWLKNLNLNFGHNDFGREFENEFWSQRLWGWDLVMILKPNLVKYLELNFGHYSEFEIRLKILKLNFGEDFEAEFR